MSEKKLFNEIVYVIENKIKLKNSIFNIEVKGFVGKNNNKASENNFLNFRDFINSRIYVFDDLFNSRTYNRKEAIDILGPCILTTAIKYSDIKDKNIENINQTEIKKVLDLSIPIWKSDVSRYFILANNKVL